ncbi:MAG: DUF2061 domain-containing protein [Loktanella sp.]|nr:DUF2061 domain-containing protein [Loktanella sp.]
MESRQRTVVKALLWQAVGLVMMCAVGWALTGSIALGGGMALINAAIGLVAYILYERLWAGIDWGRRV